MTTLSKSSLRKYIRIQEIGMNPSVTREFLSPKATTYCTLEYQSSKINHKGRNRAKRERQDIKRASSERELMSKIA